MYLAEDGISGDDLGGPSHKATQFSLVSSIYMGSIHVIKFVCLLLVDFITEGFSAKNLVEKKFYSLLYASNSAIKPCKDMDESYLCIAKRKGPI